MKSEIAVRWKRMRHLGELLGIDVPADEARDQVAERDRREPDAHHLPGRSASGRAWSSRTGRRG